MFHVAPPLCTGCGVHGYRKNAHLLIFVRDALDTKNVHHAIVSPEAPYARVGDICPKLAQPWWYKHVHSGRFFLTESKRQPSPEAQKVIQRKARKRAKHGRAEFLKAIAA